MAKSLEPTGNIVSTKEFVGVRVVSQGKKHDKRVGKVYRFVFHPTERRVVGFNVKRPDILLMFHRKDSFVALDGFHLEEGRVMINDDAAASGTAAIKRLNLDWDNCVLWLGMPIVTMSGDKIGYVGNVTFDMVTGKVQSCDVETGMANDAINGRRTIPASLIKGFVHGGGLAPIGDFLEDGEEAEIGAIVVDDAVEEIETEGGVAAAAGEATAVAADKARKAVEDMKPAMHEAAEATSEAVDKGVHAVGVQIGRSKGMFADFKKEFEEASGTTLKSPAAVLKEAREADEDNGEDAESAKASSAKAAGAAQQAAAKPAAKKAPAKKAPAQKGSAETAAHALGKQLGKASGMFAAFKEEYDKARKDD